MLLDDYQTSVVEKDVDRENEFQLCNNIRFLTTLLAYPDAEPELRYVSDLLKNTTLLIAKLGFNLDTVAQNSLK